MAQTTSKVNIHRKKVMLSVFWDYRGIVYFGMLQCNQTTNSNIYILQITKLNIAIQEKRPELVKILHSTMIMQDQTHLCVLHLVIYAADNNQKFYERGFIM